MSTLTFVYADQTAVLGPLSHTSEPHAYDLCAEHASRLTAPRGWELIHVAGEAESSDDLVALADALRPQRSRPAPAAPETGTNPAAGSGSEAGSQRRSASGRHAATGTGTSSTEPRHLHLLRSPGHE